MNQSQVFNIPRPCFFPFHADFVPLLITELIDREGPMWCKEGLCCLFAELFMHWLFTAVPMRNVYVSKGLSDTKETGKRLSSDRHVPWPVVVSH